MHNSNPQTTWMTYHQVLRKEKELQKDLHTTQVQTISTIVSVTRAMVASISLLIRMWEETQSWINRILWGDQTTSVSFRQILQTINNRKYLEEPMVLEVSQEMVRIVEHFQIQSRWIKKLIMSLIALHRTVLTRIHLNQRRIL